jgi:adenylylsulfate kinase
MRHWRRLALRFHAPAPSVVWLTGLSGSGKTTIARAAATVLDHAGVEVEVLDGDAIRALFPQTGYTQVERENHVRRVGYLASCLERHGVVVIAALISPHRQSRDFVRTLCRNFFEVHVATPLAVCEARDPKGLYARARAGLIRGFTGIDDPYEAPHRPELTLDTSRLTIHGAARQVVELVHTGRHAPGVLPSSSHTVRGGDEDFVRRRRDPLLLR